MTNQANIVDQLGRLAYHVGVLQEQILKVYDKLDRLIDMNATLTERLSKLEEKHNHATSSAALAEDVKRRQQG